MNRTIRMASISDSEAILSIYAPYVKDTAITFEIEVPTLSEFSLRIEGITKRYPYLVCQVDNQIVGYAYASEHRERAAYLYDADVSIYVLPEYHSSGVAHELYTHLFVLLDRLGYKNAYAAYTEPNIKSLKFHQKFGFEVIGTHHKTGYKLGKWHDVTWLEKTISEHDDNPEPIKLMSCFEHSAVHLQYLNKKVWQ